MGLSNSVVTNNHYRSSSVKAVIGVKRLSSRTITVEIVRGDTPSSSLQVPLSNSAHARSTFPLCFRSTRKLASISTKSISISRANSAS